MRGKGSGPEPSHQCERFDPLNMFALDFRSTGTATSAVPARPVAVPGQCWAAFETAFAHPGTGARPSCALDLNVPLLFVCGSEQMLHLPHLGALRARGADRRAGRIGRCARPDLDPRSYGAAGAFAGQCARLRLMAVEETGEGPPRIRLLDRDMQFAIEGRRVVRIRGLTPAEHVQRERQARTTARRRDTADRKARDVASPIIGRLIDALVCLDRRHAVPESWHAEGFLPEGLVGQSVAEAAAFIVEYHHVAAFDRARLAGWQGCLMHSVAQAVRRGARRGDPAEPCALPPQDEVALLALRRVGDA